ncbi:MAG: hypothetical protein AN485_23240, partial [Anabaena sp. MDT14b]
MPEVPVAGGPFSHSSPVLADAPSTVLEQPSPHEKQLLDGMLRVVRQALTGGPPASAPLLPSTATSAPDLAVGAVRVHHTMATIGQNATLAGSVTMNDSHLGVMARDLPPEFRAAMTAVLQQTHWVRNLLEQMIVMSTSWYCKACSSKPGPLHMASMCPYRPAPEVFISALVNDLNRGHALFAGGIR